MWSRIHINKTAVPDFTCLLISDKITELLVLYAAIDLNFSTTVCSWTSITLNQVTFVLRARDAEGSFWRPSLVLMFSFEWGELPDILINYKKLQSE